MFNTNGYSLADIASATKNGDMWGDGAWWIIILMLFGFGNNGWGNNRGIDDNYVLTSDFSQLSRQISDSTAMTERKLDGVTNGICSLGYDQLAQMNGINQNVSNGFASAELARSNAQAQLMAQLNNMQSNFDACCCQNRYDALLNANATQSAVKDGFCQTNFNMTSGNNAIMQAIDKVGDRVIDYISSDKMQTLRDENQALKLAASQSMQNNYLIGQLRPSPVPAYQVSNPYCSCIGTTFA